MEAFASVVRSLDDMSHAFEQGLGLTEIDMSDTKSASELARSSFLKEKEKREELQFEEIEEDSKDPGWAEKSVKGNKDSKKMSSNSTSSNNNSSVPGKEMIKDEEQSDKVFIKSSNNVQDSSSSNKFKLKANKLQEVNESDGDLLNAVTNKGSSNATLIAMGMVDRFCNLNSNERSIIYLFYMSSYGSFELKDIISATDKFNKDKLLSEVTSERRMTMAKNVHCCLNKVIGDAQNPSWNMMTLAFSEYFRLKSKDAIVNLGLYKDGKIAHWRGFCRLLTRNEAVQYLKWQEKLFTASLKSGSFTGSIEFSGRKSTGSLEFEPLIKFSERDEKEVLIKLLPSINIRGAIQLCTHTSPYWFIYADHGLTGLPARAATEEWRKILLDYSGRLVMLLSALHVRVEELKIPYDTKTMAAYCGRIAAAMKYVLDKIRSSVFGELVISRGKELKGYWK